MKELIVLLAFLSLLIFVMMPSAAPAVAVKSSKATDALLKRMTTRIKGGQS